jgi:hypothetical protein
MRKLAAVILLGMSSVAMAGELEDANRFLAAKAYDKAFPLYAKLAEAGNVEAQFRLGEMYWYGDGTAIDIPTARKWMQKASERGHPGAAESIDILKQRTTRAADIAYWTTGYKGDDLVSGRFNCPAPVFPTESKTKAKIKETTDSYAKWQECYNGFATNLNTVMQSGRHIPADVVKLFTPSEAEQAVANLNRVYEATVVQAQQNAQRVAGQYDAWQKATEKYVMAANRANTTDYEITKREMEESELRRAQSYPNPTMSAPPPSPAPGR